MTTRRILSLGGGGGDDAVRLDIERGSDDGDDVIMSMLRQAPEPAQVRAPYGARRHNHHTGSHVERFHRHHHHRYHANGWCWPTDGGGDGWACVLLAGIGFFFVFALILAAAAAGPRGHVHHSGGGYHPHGTYPGYPARQDNPHARTKREDCAAGEHWDPALKHCVITPMLPVSIDHSLIDNTVDPCEDFEQYACGRWTADPAHVDGTRSFDAIVRQNEREVAEIIRDPSVEGVHAFYRSCVEYIVEGKHQKLNSEERYRLHSLITGELNTVGDLPEVLALMRRSGLTGPFMMEVMNHPTKTTAIPVFSYDGFDPSETSPQAMRRVFKAAGDPDRMSHGKSVLLQQTLQKLQARAPAEEVNYIQYLSSARLQRDLMTFREFKALAFGGAWSDDEWDRYLVRLYGQARRIKDDDEVWVQDQDYFRQLDVPGVLDVPQWRLYIDFSIAYHTTDYFPRIPHPSYFRVHHPLLREHRYTRVRRFAGRPREPRDGPEAPEVIPHPTEFDCVRATQMLLPGLVSDEWLRRNQKLVDSFEEVGRIMRYVVDEYPRMIAETPELSQATKDALTRKYEKLVIRVGHPTEWRPEPFAERIRTDHFVHNVQMVWEYRGQRMMELWRDGEMLDRDAATRFRMPLSTVNAFYSPSSNTFSIFPGILRYPFYDRAMSDESKFAGIGAVGGHEAGHGSDKDGVFFDDEGNFHQFYTEDEMREMKERHSCLIPLYSVPESAQCDAAAAANYGAHTLGENVADLLGVTASRRAYHRYEADKGGEPNDQRFFTAYAQNWCSAPSSKTICSSVESDVHALERDRIIQPLRLVPEFAEAFQCKPTAGMVHMPRCRPFGGK